MGKSSQSGAKSRYQNLPMLKRNQPSYKKNTRMKKINSLKHDKRSWFKLLSCRCVFVYVCVFVRKKSASRLEGL